MKTTRVLLTALLLVGVLELSLLLLSSGTLHAETIRVAENLRGETVILPSSAPETDRFILVSFVTIAPEGSRRDSSMKMEEPGMETEKIMDTPTMHQKKRPVRLKNAL